MIKARNKKISLILVLAMVMTMFAGIGTASAAATYSVASVPTVNADGSAQDLASITVNIDLLEGDATGTKDHSFLLKLPNKYKFDWTSGNEPYVVVAKDGDGVLGAGTKVTATRSTDSEALFELTTLSAVAIGTDVTLVVVLPNVTVEKDASGECEAIITALDGQFSDAKITVAKAGKGDVTVAVTDTVTVTGAGTFDSTATKGSVVFTVKEDANESLEIDKQALKLRLPRGFEWNTTKIWVEDVTNPATNLIGTDFAINNTKSDERNLVLERNANTNGKRSVFRIYADVNVQEDDAAFGDIKVAVEGPNVKTSSVIIGAYSDFGYALSVKDSAKEIIAGRVGDDAEISTISIKEDVEGSIINNRTLYMELPDGVEFNNVGTPAAPAPDITVDNVKGSLAAPASASFVSATNKSKAKIVLSNGAGIGAIDIDAKLKVAVDYTGDITVKFSGSAGINDEVVVAKAVAPVAVQVAPKEIKVGVQGQDGANIYITETVAEAIDPGAIALRAPAGASWTVVPTVKVVEGDIKLGTPTRMDSETFLDTLIIPVQSTSGEASKIEISNIKYSVARYLPEGPMVVLLGGTGLDKAGIVNRTVAAKIPAANIVTPAPEGTKNVAVFNYGETSYILNGAPVQMDVAPYAKNNRTYVPVRYCANALGISDNNIIWDQANKTVTMMKGDKVVQLTLGSNIMRINGVDVRMDVTVEAQNNRTFLPAAWVAQAFGAKAVWDPANPNTVVVSY